MRVHDIQAVATWSSNRALSEVLAVAYWRTPQSLPLTFSASLLSQTGHLASSRPSSPKSVVPSRAQEALPDDGTWGGSLGHESSGVQSGKHTVFVDALSFLKWSQTKMQGDRRSIPPLLSLAWDPDVVVARSLTCLPILDPWVRFRLLMTSWSVKCLQSLCPQEVGSVILHRVTPLLRPRLPRGRSYGNLYLSLCNSVSSW